MAFQFLILFFKSRGQLMNDEIFKSFKLIESKISLIFSAIWTSEVFIKRVETLAVSLSVRCFFGDSSAPASTYSPSKWARSQQWLTTKALSKFFNFSNYTNMVDIWTLKHRWNLFLFDYSLGLFTEFFGNFEYSKSYAGSKFFTSMLL